MSGFTEKFKYKIGYTYSIVHLGRIVVEYLRLTDTIGNSHALLKAIYLHKDIHFIISFAFFHEAFLCFGSSSKTRIKCRL